MYGTVARMRVKPSAETAIQTLMKEYEGLALPGSIATYIYQMDADPLEFYMATVWESREAYIANANSPGQHARYLKMIDLLDGAPEWHDGQIVQVVA
ncbi:MAG: antibiotic biosynthesis monooxygenase [Chloroflexi bacterium]|nr:antibiotic biosynthesis monooxygenase [Chloroflexota bacterium]